MRAELAKAAMSRRHGLFETHPSDQQRVNAARALEAPGLFTIETDTRVLFAAFDQLSRLATLDLYRTTLGLDVRPEHLRPTSEFVESIATRTRGRAAIERFYFDRYVPQRLLSCGPATFIGESGSALVKRMARARGEMRELATDMGAAAARLEEAIVLNAGATLGERLHKGSVRVGAVGLRVPASPSAVEAARRRAASTETAALVQFQHLDTLSMERVGAAVALLEHRAYPGDPETVAAQRGAAARLIPVFGALLSARPTILRLRDELRVIMRLGEGAPGEDCSAAVERTITPMLEGLRGLRLSLLDVMDPFDTERPARSLGVVAVPRQPDRKDWATVFEAVDGALQTVFDRHHRIIGHLVEIATDVEETLAAHARQRREAPSSAGVETSGGESAQ
ncbi:MAG: hypothetical protein KDA25_03215, partial [Phycisphaerales bacterium]|nr:hypothetical protein [Phycisphaerales bacterium]